MKFLHPNQKKHDRHLHDTLVILFPNQGACPNQLLKAKSYSDKTLFSYINYFNLIVKKGGGGIVEGKNLILWLQHLRQTYLGIYKLFLIYKKKFLNPPINSFYFI